MPAPPGLLGTNLTGAIMATKAAVKHANKAGMSIVMISSVAPTNPGGAGMAAYAASKGGMDGTTVALARELAGRRIRVNAVAAAAVETAIWESVDREQYDKHIARYPLGVGKPVDVALACVYLLSEASRWMTGSVLTLDGGFLTS